jgi:hypothetical protein
MLDSLSRCASARRGRGQLFRPGRRLAFLIAAFVATAAACSSADAPNRPLTIAPEYHLKAVDGVPLPIVSGGGSLDSGHVLRLGGDTVRVDHVISSPPSNGAPGIVVISLGLWVASQSGNVVVLSPAIASSIDTAFVGNGDTLTLHAHSGGALHVETYVAP